MTDDGSDGNNGNWKESFWATHNGIGCSNEKCNLHAHLTAVKSDHFFFTLPQFSGMTCFEIAHNLSTTDLWASNAKFKYKQHGTRDERKPNERRAYSVITSHPIYLKFNLNMDCKARRERRSQKSKMKILKTMKSIVENSASNVIY